MTLDQIAFLGQAADERIRLSKARVDTAERVAKVTSGRNLIYQKGYAPGNEHTEYFLKPESLVPTEVCYLWHAAQRLALTSSFHRMRSLELY